MLKNSIAVRICLALISTFTIVVMLLGCGSSDETTVQDVRVISAAIDTTNVDQTEAIQLQKSIPDTQTEEKSVVEVEGRVEGEGGGNPEYNDKTTIVYEVDVLIDENKYYYQNSPISLDDLLEEIDAIDGEIIVFISENNASQNAYEELTKKLNEKEIKFDDR